MCNIMPLALSLCLKESLLVERQNQNPELFEKNRNESFAAIEENSEVNRFLGWSIYSTMKRFAGELAVHKGWKKLLL